MEPKQIRDPDIEICKTSPHIQRSCTNSGTEEIMTRTFCTSSCTDFRQELLQYAAERILSTLRKRSSESDCAQVVLQDPDADIITKRSCARGPQIDAEILALRYAQESAYTEVVHRYHRRS